VTECEIVEPTTQQIDVALELAMRAHTAARTAFFHAVVAVVLRASRSGEFMNIPSTLRAGDVVDSLPDYPAPTWDLVYYFRGPQAFTVVGVRQRIGSRARGRGRRRRRSIRRASMTGIARVNDGTNYKTIGSGRLTVEPDLANAAVEYRSFWRQVLDELEPVILGRASTDQLTR
jgi:hypothetical protein